MDARLGTAVRSRLRRAVSGRSRSIFPCANPTLAALASLSPAPPASALLFAPLSRVGQERGHVATPPPHSNPIEPAAPSAPSLSAAAARPREVKSFNAPESVLS